MLKLVECEVDTCPLHDECCEAIDEMCQEAQLAADEIALTIALKEQKAGIIQLLKRAPHPVEVARVLRGIIEELEAKE